jgi:hypothetical protein
MLGMFFIGLVTLVTSWHWLTGQASDLPTAIMVLLALWGGTEAISVPVFWRPLLFWFHDET